MEVTRPAYVLDHPRGWRHLYRFPNGLGASVIPYNPAVADLTQGTVDVLFIEWSGAGPDDWTEWKPQDWAAVEDFIRQVDSQGGDVYYGTGGCELECVPEAEVPALLQLIAALR
ncbi:hypothetical protein [Micromonospora maritima]|uniref:hypothetical protein n=1 Tax=Micromonospora maritima TaxID=986711 RepID=UPI00157D62E7|nr:hypothetical protein [Micromonospora maritima]